MNPPPSRQNRFRFTLRTFAGILIAINIAVAAWFYGTWEVTQDESTFSSATPSQVDCLASAVRELGFIRYNTFSLDQERQAASGSVSTSLPRESLTYPVWVKQVSSVRFDANEGLQKHGLTRVYYHGGALCGTENWSGGLRHGKTELLYPNGSPLARGQWTNGLRHGEWLAWHPNGEVAAKATFDNKGNPTGRWELHYQTPDAPFLSAEERERPFTADAFWFFDASGLIRIEEHRRDEDKERRIVRPFIANKREGRQENRDEQGRLRFAGEWSKDLPHGNWVSYDDKGASPLRAEFKNGVLISVNDKAVSWSILGGSDSNGLKMQSLIVDETRERLCIRRAVWESPQVQAIVNLDWEWRYDAENRRWTDFGYRVESSFFLIAALDLKMEERSGWHFLEPKQNRPPLDAEAEMNAIAEERKGHRRFSLAVDTLIVVFDETPTKVEIPE